MIRILETIDTDIFLKTFNSVEPSIQWTEYGHKGKQAGVQYRQDENPWTSAVGKSTGQEQDVNLINSVFKDTVFESIINQYHLTRSRLMWVYPFACYSMHKDYSCRLHIPLVTNKDCYFVFKDQEPQHLALGNIYLTDTRKFHTFMNCSDSPRLHFVGICQEKF